MGSRAAVTAANEFATSGPGKPDIKGVLCLSYPLHPPNDVTKLRDEILHSCHLPMLFVSGTQDALCEKQLMEDTLKNKKNATTHWIESGDHGFNVKGEDKSVTVSAISDAVGIWCQKMMCLDGGKTQKHLPSGTVDASVTSSGTVDASVTSSPETSGKVNSGRKRGKSSKVEDGRKSKKGKKGKD